MTETLFKAGDRVKYLAQERHGTVVISHLPQVVCVLMDNGVHLGFLHDDELEFESPVVALSRAAVPA
jgi:hypothetical protein